MRKIVIIGLLLLLSFVGIAMREKSAPLKPYKVVVPEFVGDYFEPIHIAPDNPLSEEGVALGRRLFYDTKLSSNNTISCGSCHLQQYAFADNKAFSLGVHDSVGIMNSMPIFNLGWGRQFFWDGRADGLVEQATDPIINTKEMASNWADVLAHLQEDKQYPTLFERVFGSSTINATMVAKALAQFQMSITSFNTRFDQYYFEGDATALTPQEERGLDIFFGFGNCNHCHSDVLLTDNFFRNNGLDEQPDPGLYNTTGKATDRGRFKVPSLRNIALTAPYMHDGRFKTLEEVVAFYSTGIKGKSPNLDEHIEPFKYGLHLTPEQQADVVAFLRTLTDSSLLNNKAYSNPFAKPKK
jgi:cytochrome c peroxidase